jgi:uncharacterized protein (TIGR02246 family)
MSFERYAQFIVAVLFAVVVGSAAAPALAEPRDEAVAVVERWVEAFNASDVAAIVELYAADATFIGTSSRAILTTSADIRRYFEQALLSNRPRSATLGERVVAELDDGAVLVSGLDVTTGTRNGAQVNTPGRVTFVIALRGERWRIVHFHRSALPN